MKTNCFDAVVDFYPEGKRKRVDARLRVRKEVTSASIHFYESVSANQTASHFVRVHTHQFLSLRWKDHFDVLEPGKRRLLGKGLVLSPFSEKVAQTRIKSRIAFLKGLEGDKKSALSALSREKGTRGLREEEMKAFFPAGRESLLRMTQDLEEEGEIRILSFTPLLLISQKSLDFLCQKIIDFVTDFHERYPEQSGASQERIQRRFDPHPRVLSLALKHLLHADAIQKTGEKFSLPDFRVMLTPDDNKILKELEKMCLKGEFRMFSFEDLKKHFKLTTKKLDMMLSLLIEKKKIIQGKDGLLLHSRWLDEIIWDLKKSGKKELTIAEFKEITGLTRKFAIPLLELLDQIGVTRRKGSSREIL